MKTISFPYKAFLIVSIAVLFALPLQAQSSSGVNSDGRDFYLGLMFPSYNKVASPATEAFWGAYALISGYGDKTTVRVSYFDPQTGVEIPGQRYFIPERTGIQVKLDSLHMVPSDAGDIAEFRCCHITSDQPVNIQFFSTGACSGGSYLALSTPSLGKKYVIASYGDNPGQLSAIGGRYQPLIAEVSHGCFEIIAAFDSTKISITSNSTTAGGHPGFQSGAKPTYPLETPYFVTLKRGQCYFVKSASDDTGDDISGSIITSDKPIAVLAGHENAALGGLSSRSLEGRDYMVEQMIPVDFWDTTGYVSIPLKDSQPADPQSFEGVGENYRIYTWDTIGSKVLMYDACIGSPYDVPAGRLALPTQERYGVTCPVDFETTNGKKFSVMMYDLRNFANSAPYPAPSMMTIIPISRWKTSFMWYVPANQFETLQAYYVDVLGLRGDFDLNTGILASFNGGMIRPIKQVLALDGQYKQIPNHPELNGIRFKLYPGSYYATGPHPFMVYNFGFRGLDPDHDLGDFDGEEFFFSYANPTGASLSNGDPGKFGVTIDSQCGKWNICVHDLRKTDRGIRSVSLLNDSKGIQFSPGKKSVNCHLDPGFDPDNFGEVELPGTDSVVCFKVLVNFPIDTAYAAVLITDNAGNLRVVELRYTPVKLSLSPKGSPITFTNLAIGSDSCIFFTIRNDAAASQIIQSADLVFGKDFSLALLTPVLPAALQPGDSLVIKICFAARDTALVIDTLNVALECLRIPIALTGRGVVGLIYATDYDAGKVDTGVSVSRVLTVTNIGTKPFTLKNNWTITGSNAFSFITSPALPVILKPHDPGVIITVTYLPKAVRKDTATILWSTDIETPYTQSVKSYSILTGEGIVVKSSVKEPVLKSIFSVHPNPASGGSIILSFNPSQNESTDVSIYDVLGREVYKRYIISDGSENQEVGIPIRNLENGIYYARLSVGGKTLTEKFEVMR